jgi:hypothetical protein
MKLAAIVLVLAGTALAQRGPGGAHTGAVRSGGRTRFVSPPLVSHPVHTRTAIVPYPVYYGYGYYGYYGYDPSVPVASQSAPAYDTDPNAYADASQSPVVVINQGFRPDSGNGVMRDYSDTPLPESAYGPPPPPRDPQATIYLIAMQDHSIVAAIGYWVEGDTLNYITQDGNQNRVSMALVDRDFSKQLNDERHVEFKLPKTN